MSNELPLCLEGQEHEWEEVSMCCGAPIIPETVDICARCHEHAEAENFCPTCGCVTPLFPQASPFASGAQVRNTK